MVTFVVSFQWKPYGSSRWGFRLGVAGICHPTKLPVHCVLPVLSEEARAAASDEAIVCLKSCVQIIAFILQNESSALVVFVHLIHFLAPSSFLRGPSSTINYKHFSTDVNSFRTQFHNS